MVHELPWELIEEILSRVPPRSFVCFRTVSKRWNALFDDKMFLNNHKSTFRFVLTTKFKIYSVSIDPKIVVRELTLDIPGLESQIPKKLVDSREFLLCHMDKGAAVWNPWLKQTRVMIMPEVGQLGSQIHGIGRVEEKVDKTLGFNNWKGILNHNESKWKIHDFATGVWKDKIKPESSGTTTQGSISCTSVTSHTTSDVSLNGNLYWIAFYDKTDPLYHLVKFDFSSEKFFKFCDLPCPKNHPCDVLALGVFKENRFSLLKQCHVTKKIEIWVTKDKINNDYDDVVWMTFMEVSSPNLPDLVQTGSDSRPSYFIEDKRLVVCCCDETGRAWIYVMEANKLISKIKLESVADLWPSHCTHFPNLVPVPRRQREEAELQV